MVARIPESNNACRARRFRRSDRRGVLLLVVLSILVLFVVIALTFVLIAGHFRRGARSEPIVERYTNDPQRQLDDAIYQVFRGTDNAQSVIGPHSLLEDMYGNNSISGYLSAVPALTTTDNPSHQSGQDNGSGQLVDLHVTALVPNTFNQTNGYYNGQVLTMVSGPARGLSTRIVGYTPNGDTTGATATFRVMGFDGLVTSNFIGQYNANIEQRFVVNGRPFNGTGFGFNQNTGQLSSGSIYGTPPPSPPPSQFVYYQALMPNPKYFSPSNNSLYAVAGGLGGADEDYDAPDPQNMALAWIPVNAVGVGPVNQLIFPSFHRPDLVSWWAVQQDQVNSVPPWSDPSYPKYPQNGPALQRQVILRPLSNPTDHPLFTGSNANFNPITGPWDVDNDGDGIPDSIWLDLGYPVQTAPDGKTYKPLFAFLILDLDGRLNVNAHGNYSQTAVADANSDLLNAALVQGPFAITANNQNPPTSTYNGSNPSQNTAHLPRGQGYGPAEINPGFGLTVGGGGNGVFPSLQAYQQLFWGTVGGTSATNYDGRYGELPLLANSTTPLPGNTNTSSSADDALSAIKHFEVPQNYFTPFTNPTTAAPTVTAFSNLTNYGTPSDLWGRGALALDYRGQPIFSFPIANAQLYGGTLPAVPVSNFEVPHSPYSINLSQKAVRMSGTDVTAANLTGNVDNPYTPGELERLLRRFDVDSYSLADRLRAIIDPNNNNALLARLLTTDSFDLPSPNSLLTTEVRNLVATKSGGTFANATNATVVDMLRTKLQYGSGGLAGMSNPTMPLINIQLQKMLPPEVVAGQYMDVNRPFGNARDDNGNYVVDEPQEYTANNTYEAAWNSLFPNAAAAALDLINGIDVNNDGYSSFSGAPMSTFPGVYNTLYTNPQAYARQLYARHLYVLMMTLMDQGFTDTVWAGADQKAGVPVANELTARRIAQWAINVVDYRDADSIMTPFEYDVNPFDGWDVDGIVDTTGDGMNNGVNERRVVWGCEYPELMLTETFATHDRRVRDSSYDTNPTKPGSHSRYDTTPAPLGPLVVDSTLDQIRVPQGSLFVELYCPRGNSALASPTAANPGGSQAVFPAELYTYLNGQWYLNLGAMAPVDTNTNVQSPVWRLAITSSTSQNPNNNIQTQITSNPFSVTLDPPGDPFNYSVFTPGPNSVTIDRIAWFAATAPSANDPHINNIYYNRGVAANTQVLLSPGGYAVLGPRSQTNYGRSQLGNIPTPLSPQAFALTPNNNPSTANSFNPATGSMGYTDNGGNPNTIYSQIGTSIQQPVTIICAGAPPTTWTKNPSKSALLDTNSHTGIGISVSEPLFSDANYYAEPTVPDTGVQGSNPTAYYGSVIDSYGAENQGQAFPDVPYECSLYGTTALLSGTTVNTRQYPLNVDKLWATKTTLNYKFVLLQRLANPLLPYNPMPNDPNEAGAYDAKMPVNPYITTDWMPINLTVFNGESLKGINPPPAGQSIDPDDPNYPLNPSATLTGYTSVQRGVTVAPGSTGNNLWSPFPQDSVPQNTNGVGTNSLVFDFNLNSYRQSLGFLNSAFVGNANYTGHPWSTADVAQLPKQYVGDPNPANWSVGKSNSNVVTFPWINWANRPFVSQYEMMQVPASSPTRLMLEVGNTLKLGLGGSSPYGTGVSATDFQNPFAHLLNFLLTAPQAINGTPPTTFAPHFYRLFEYARVPSRFVGTDTMLNPTAMAADTTPPFNTVPTDGNEKLMFSYLHPPFNKVSKYRDPGKVNINTIPHLAADLNPIVWSAIQDTLPTTGAFSINGPQPQSLSGPTWAQVSNSIQGGVGGWTPASGPSMFANPFRSFAGADFNLPNTVEHKGVEVTFLRPDPTTATAMLFDFPPPMAGNNLYQGYNAPDRNSYFRYQNLQRMGNLLTTRSNVYACWVTVGYFQVQPWTGSPNNTPANSPVDNVHPDGYQLADELGADTGEIVRHRGFYIFDRTIPVAFERGLNHNVDRAIILRRYIE